MKALLRGGAGLLLVCAGGVTAGADLAPIQPGLDYHSFANIEQFRVTHMELVLRVDFYNKVLFGAVELEIKRLDPRATELVLDTRDLEIRDVEEKPSSVLGATAKSETTWVSRPFHLDKADPILGSPLIIELPPVAKKSTETVRIEYVTSPTSQALQWLTDKQTSDKSYPLMYTLSEPIGARSWIPSQDTPQARTTIAAHIHSVSDVIVLMSAKNDPQAKHNGLYSSALTDPVPVSRLGLAAGDFRFKATGPRTGVYAEKHVVSSAAESFANAEALLAAAEKLLGPYRWERFDILVLPPSFPLMEAGNARLAFISQTLVTRDQNPFPVALAVAQSWSGNLVSNATWRDVWVTAGMAEYLADRLMAEVAGARRDAMERDLAARRLRGEIAALPPRDVALAMDTRGRDPALALNGVPEEKGRLFFTWLETRFGREHFDEFLRGYFDHFALKSIGTESFLAYLQTNLLDRFPGTVTPEQLAVWTVTLGLPATAVVPAPAEFAQVDAARSQWLDGKLPAKKLDTHAWSVPQWRYFLDGMPALRKEQLDELDDTYKFARGVDADVDASWLALVIKNRYQPGFPLLEHYLETVGRIDLVLPLYAELMKTPAGATTARRVFAVAKPAYQARTVAAVEALVNAGAESSDDE
jgi:leukotriene-A4 hydrolase